MPRRSGAPPGPGCGSPAGSPARVAALGPSRHSAWCASRRSRSDARARRGWPVPASADRRARAMAHASGDRPLARVQARHRAQRRTAAPLACTLARAGRATAGARRRAGDGARRPEFRRGCWTKSVALRRIGGVRAPGGAEPATPRRPPDMLEAHADGRLAHRRRRRQARRADQGRDEPRDRPARLRLLRRLLRLPLRDDARGPADRGRQRPVRERRPRLHRRRTACRSSRAARSTTWTP